MYAARARTRKESALEGGDVPVGRGRVLPVRHADAARIPDDAPAPERHVARKLAPAGQARATAVGVLPRAIDPAQDRDIGLRAFRQRPELRMSDRAGGRDGGAIDG